MRILLISAFLALACTALSQSTIRGFVYDNATGESVFGVQVYLPELEQGTITDLNGYYELENVAEGTHTLEVTFIGYAKYSKSLVVGAGVMNENVLLESSGKIQAATLELDVIKSMP